jgi:hypothetical protein
MQIAPRSFNQILNDGIVMLGRVWKSLLVPAVGASILLGAATLIVFRLTGADQFIDLLFTDPLAFDSLTTEQLADIAVPFLQGALIALILNIVATGFINLATHRVVGTVVAGSPITGGAAGQFALSRLSSLILAFALAIVAVTIGFLLLWVPGIWLAVMFSMTVQVMALEGTGVVDSLRRSFDLVRGRWWPTAGFILLVGLLGTSAGWMIQLVAAPLLVVGSVSASSGLAFVLGTLVQGVMIAAIAVMTTVWYLDLRARKEQLFSENLI